MWVRFTERFTWNATATTSIVYRPTGGPFKDGRYSVTSACATAADGVAKPVPTPKRPR